MAPKKKTKEEILLKAKLARRERYAKIKADPEKYAREKEKEHERYLKRKAEKKLKSIEEMTPRGKRQQRKKWRESFKRHYAKQKLQKRGVQQLQLRDANIPSCSEADAPITVSEDDDMAVRDPVEDRNIEIAVNRQDPLIPNQDSSLLENIKKRLRRLQYIFKLKEQKYKSTIEILQKSLQRSKKIIERLKKRLQSPNSKVERLIKNKNMKQELKKKVLFGEAMKKTLEINYSILKSKKDKKLFTETVTPNKAILKQHKVLTETKTFTVRDKTRTYKQNKYENVKEEICKFFERDDISRMTAGRKETITKNKIKKQRRYLLDSMKNLHKLYEEEHSKVSYSFFCKQRPFWVMIPNVDDRETVLCKIHANMLIFTRVLNKRKILKEKDIKEVILQVCCSSTECLLERCNNCNTKQLEYNLESQDPVVLELWQYEKETYVSKGIEKEHRVTGKKKKCVSPKEAVAEFEKLIPIFLKHEGIRRSQFSAIKILKEQLKENEAIIHIDFSENYAFKYASEIQAFHFGGSRKELTLHTAVVYYMLDGQITCKSFCTVSENMRHDAAAVWAHIIPLLEFVESFGNIDSLHFQSDSPSSQYRNKTMFYIISKLYWHYRDLKLITWNYTEAGHGKGAADGIGGTVKRIADAAVAHGKDIISIEDFVLAVTYSAKNVIINGIEEYQIYEKDLLIPSDQLKSLKGTMKVHQVLWKSNTKDLIFRETSCFVCHDRDCIHTKFIGVLNYNTESTLPQTVNPKDIIITKTSKRTPYPKQLNPDKENVNITSELIIKSASKNNVEATLISDIRPDTKIHLQNVSISEMVNAYNVSGIEANFSGAFEDFVNSKNDLTANQSKFKRSDGFFDGENETPVKNLKIDSDSEDEFNIFPLKKKYF